jgi:hypothetical protein
MKRQLHHRVFVLIWLHLEIDNLFTQTELPLYTERLSNNAYPFFTDTELFTSAFFAELMKGNNRKSGCQGYL